MLFEPHVLTGRWGAVLMLVCVSSATMVGVIFALSVTLFLQAPQQWGMPLGLSLVVGLILLLLVMGYRWVRCRWFGPQQADLASLAQAKVWLQTGQTQAACDVLMPLARLGCADAQILLGRLYLKGHGVKRDYAAAYGWLKAAKRYPEAQNLLGVIHQNGYLGQKKLSAAFRWYRRSARQGLAAAQNHLGFLYLVGLGVLHNEHEAYAWFHKAAQQGWLDAQLNLAFMAYYGPGILQQTPSFKGYRQSLEKSPQSEAVFDFLYPEARAQNYSEAYQWYKTVADTGHAMAQYSVGLMTELGQGVVRDVKQAEFWYLQAGLQHYPPAIEALIELYQDQSRVFNEDHIEHYLKAFQYQQHAQPCPICDAEIRLQWPTLRTVIECPRCAHVSRIQQCGGRVVLGAVESKKGPNVACERIVLACPKCHQKMRLPKPTQAQRLVCVGCQQSLRVLLEREHVVLAIVSGLVRTHVPPNPKPWYDVLALPVGASLTQVKQARKRLMQQYHPDKVAHLDVQKQAIAEAKSKQINVAYQKLAVLLSSVHSG